MTSLSLIRARATLGRTSNINTLRLSLGSKYQQKFISTSIFKPVISRSSRQKPVTLPIPFRITSQYRFASTTKKDTSPINKSVSEESTTRSITHELGEEGPHQLLGPGGDYNTTKSVKGDLKAVKETFALKSVPREALYFGLAGVIPYVATSLTTVFCAWDLNYAANHDGFGWVLSLESASTLLSTLEPIQVGYGAVILSFLGAVHWGLEWAAFGGVQGYQRYAIGALAPLIAWPSMLLPFEYALGAQAGAFTLLYFIDSQLTVKGWVPPWYATYRFVLTLFVGVSLMISLIGRGEINDVKAKKSLPSAIERIRSRDHVTEKRAEYESEKAIVMEKEQKKKEEAERKEREKEKQKQKQQQQKQQQEKENKEDEDQSEGSDK